MLRVPSGLQLHPTSSATGEHTQRCRLLRVSATSHAVCYREAYTRRHLLHVSPTSGFTQRVVCRGRIVHRRCRLPLFRRRLCSYACAAVFTFIFISRTTLDGIRGPCRTAPTLARSRRGSSVMRPAATSGQQTTPGAADDVSVYCNVFRAADESRDGSFSTFWVARPGL